MSLGSYDKVRFDGLEEPQLAQEGAVALVGSTREKLFKGNVSGRQRHHS